MTKVPPARGSEKESAILLQQIPGSHFRHKHYIKLSRTLVSWILPLSNRSTHEKSTTDMTREESTGSQEDKVLPMKATPLTPRTVHFDFDRSTIHPHITLDELSDDEFFSVWVTDDEFAASKKDYLAIVRKMMKDADFVETEDCCPRGLGKSIDDCLIDCFISVKEPYTDIVLDSFCLIISPPQNSRPRRVLVVAN